ncbi:hypothetical protein LXA43DRAFT_884172 [Ganoderma leucocontextum]|nr:hypothetical protein LXA43DRAFT_884172 [Ganoderma leucocontextum]
MATAVHLPSPETAGTPVNDVPAALVSPNAHTHSNSYSLKRLTLTDLDLRDDRYPSISSVKSSPPSARSQFGRVDPAIDAGMTTALRASYEKTYGPDTTTPQKSWLGENITQEPAHWQSSQNVSPAAVLEAQPGSPTARESARPAGNSPVEPYPADEQATSGPSAASPADHASSTAVPLPQSLDMSQQLSKIRPSGDQYDVTANSIPPSNASLSLLPGVSPTTPVLSPGGASSPRHPLVPGAGNGTSPNVSTIPPIVPLSAGPTYNPSTMQIPISPKPRAYAQHPTYITPSTAPAMQPSFSPPQVPKEEVCVECAMRDQDMADVDVTSPGMWERESDVFYEELCRQEAEEEASGVSSSNNPSRPQAKGGKLTEENLRFWMSINPKEPSSRQQTLDQYVKSQRSLIEVDALSRARALRESRLLDEKMRDTFSQLRRSAYELGSSTSPVDDYNGLRIKTPRVPSSAQAQVHSREVTLLENGMIVEHVDLRKEEREERDRKRRSEKREKRELSRVRKSSRSSRSAADVASVYSVPLVSPLPQADSGFFSNPRDSRYSQSFSPRPVSVLAIGGERPPMLRAQSQASFSEVQSVGSAPSPRRSRFFGFKNLSSAWHSRDSVAPTGSMIDMHLALQQEQQYFAAHPSAVDISSNTPTLRASQSWPRTVTSPEPVAPAPLTSTKKKSGLKKIWKLVTGTSKGSAKGSGQSRSVDRHEDDTPLAPPPPLSYLVDREGTGRRHVSTPSLLSSISPNQFSQWASSPPTAPSSALPSPTSSRYPALVPELNGELKDQPIPEMVVPDHRISAFEPGSSNDGTPNELDIRGRIVHSPSRTLSSLGPPTPGATTPSNRPQSAVILRRDKSLPPLPGESRVEFPSHPMPETRPQTMYDLLQTPSNPMTRGLPPPQAAFRTPEVRRQSFGGMASMPHPAAQTLPARSAYARPPVNVPPFLAEENYAEFGASSPALSQWAAPEPGKRSLTTPGKPKQRRSRFGLASLFGKKSVEMERPELQMDIGGLSNASGSMEPLDYNPYRSSASDQRDEPSWNGAGGPGSSHSSAPRMSIMSKSIAELVEQDPEFVAYRYPSSDQRLEVMR